MAGTEGNATRASAAVHYRVRGKRKTDVAQLLLNPYVAAHI